MAQQTVKLLKDGRATKVTREAESWQALYDEVVTEYLESVANQTFEHEKVVIFDEDGSVAKTIEPSFESRGDLPD